MTYILILPTDLYSSSNREITSPLLFPLRLSKRKGLAESLFLNEYRVLKMISACFLYIPWMYLGPVSYGNFTRWFQKDPKWSKLIPRVSGVMRPPLCAAPTPVEASLYSGRHFKHFACLTSLNPHPDPISYYYHSYRAAWCLIKSVLHSLLTRHRGEHSYSLHGVFIWSSLYQQLSELNFKKCSSAKWELRTTHPSPAKG